VPRRLAVVGETERRTSNTEHRTVEHRTSKGGRFDVGVRSRVLGGYHSAPFDRSGAAGIVDYIFLDAPLTV